MWQPMIRSWCPCVGHGVLPLSQGEGRQPHPYRGVGGGGRSPDATVLRSGRCACVFCFGGREGPGGLRSWVGGGVIEELSFFLLPYPRNSYSHQDTLA